MSITDMVAAAAVALVVYLLYIYLFGGSSTASSPSAVHDARSFQVVKASSLPTNVSTNYAYSIWFYIDDWSYRFKQDKTLFERKGSAGGPAPRVYLSGIENNVNVDLGVWEAKVPATSTCTVDNVPLQAWTNLIISINGRALDVYINGKLVRTCLLDGVPRAAPAAGVDITPDGGFSGYTSGFQYFSTPLSPQQAYNIYASGYGGGSSLGAIFDRYRVRIGVVENDRTVARFEL
jgi:hypothetical protein